MASNNQQRSNITLVIHPQRLLPRRKAAMASNNRRSNIRDMKMIAIDGGANVLQEDLGYLRSKPATRSAIISGLKRHSYSYVYYDAQDADSRKSLVITFLTSGKKLDFMFEKVSDSHEYVVSFHNSADMEIVSRWRPINKDESSVGFSSESRLMSLPLEMKLSILSFLPGFDIAKLACVCSEFKSLCHSEDLWRQKLKETFDEQTGPRFVQIWKHNFATIFKFKNYTNKMQGISIHIQWSKSGPHIPSVQEILGLLMDSF